MMHQYNTLLCRGLTWLLSCALIISTVPTTASTYAMNNAEHIPYKLEEVDISYAGDYLMDKNIIQGQGTDGQLHPEWNINRAEMMKMAMKAYEEIGGIYDHTLRNCFPDVQNQWFAEYICAAKELGIINGYMDGYFHPADNVTHAQSFKIIAEVFEDFTPFIQNDEVFQLDRKYSSGDPKYWHSPYTYLFLGGGINHPKYRLHPNNIIKSEPIHDEPAPRGDTFYYLQRTFDKRNNPAKFEREYSEFLEAHQQTFREGHNDNNQPLDKISSKLQEKGITLASTFTIPDITLNDVKFPSIQHKQTYRVAYIEMEAENNNGIELTQELITPIHNKMTEIFSEISGGRSNIDPAFTVLPKWQVKERIDSSNFNNKANKLIEDNFINKRPATPIDIIIIMGDIDAELIENFLTIGGLGLDQGYDNDIQLYINLEIVSKYLNKDRANRNLKINETAYTILHEIMHSYEFGNIKDAYTLTPEKFPYMSFRYTGLFGVDSDNFPMSYILARNSFRNYNLITFQPNTKRKITIDNICNPNASTTILPIQFHYKENEEHLLETYVFDVRGKNNCDQYIVDPGLYIHKVYISSNGRIIYSHSLPASMSFSTEKNPFSAAVFALENIRSTPLQTTEGSQIFEPDIIDYSSNYSDQFINMQVTDHIFDGDYLDAMTIELTMKDTPRVTTLPGGAEVNVYHGDHFEQIAVSIQDNIGNAELTPSITQNNISILNINPDYKNNHQAYSCSSVSEDVRFCLDVQDSITTEHTGHGAVDVIKIREPIYLQIFGNKWLLRDPNE